jgi:hypothetical protein
MSIFKLSDVLLTLPICLVDLIIIMVGKPFSSIKKTIVEKSKHLIIKNIKICIQSVGFFTIKSYTDCIYSQSQITNRYTIKNTLSKKIKQILNGACTRCEKEQEINSLKLLPYDSNFNHIRWRLRCKLIKKSANFNISAYDRKVIYLLECSYIKILYGVRLPVITTKIHIFSLTSYRIDLKRLGQLNMVFFNKL